MLNGKQESYEYQVLKSFGLIWSGNQTRAIALGGWGEISPLKNYFSTSKQFYLVVTNKFLLHFRSNWHQNNNKWG